MHYLIYLDIDEKQTPERIEMLNETIRRVSSMLHCRLELVAVHDTARGFHAIVNANWSDAKPITPLETVCLQLLLGSDPKRETFNFLRARNLGDAPAFWRDRWNVLYSEKITE